MRVHHTGIVSSSIEKDITIYRELGYTQQGEPILDRVQHNRLVFMVDAFGQRIELIEPLNEQSTVKNAKAGIHHICYEIDTPNLADAIAMIREKKMGVVFTKPMVAPAFGDRKIIFAYLKTGLIVEFLEGECVLHENSR